MENSLIKRVVLVVAAIAVVAGAAVAVIALLGGVTPRETGTVAGAGGRIDESTTRWQLESQWILLKVNQPHGR